MVILIISGKVNVKTLSNFSKSTRRSHLILDLINAVFMGFETVNHELMIDDAIPNIIKTTEKMKHDLIGQKILKLPEKKYNQYIGILNKLKSELNKEFPNEKMNPFVICNVLFHLVEIQFKNIPDLKVKLKESWGKLRADFLDLFLRMQETEPEERKTANWESHFAIKGSYIGNKFIEIIER